MAEKRRIGLFLATMLVAGNMIGSGIFLLPASMASIGSASSWGWAITVPGAMVLAMVFAILGLLSPQAGGPYAIARDALGPFAGFQCAALYWISNVVGNVAIALSVTGYATVFWPVLAQPIPAALVTSAIIWLATLANIFGPRLVTKLESATTLLGLVPILGLGLFGWFWFNPDLFAAGWNVSGTSDGAAIRSAGMMMFWAFTGLESASVAAAVVENPHRNVPLATIGGVLFAAVVYVSSTVVLFGLVPEGQLKASAAPFAEAAILAIGPVAGTIITLCAIIKSFGALGGWTLIVAEIGEAAGRDGMFLKLFCRVDRRGVPVTALVVVAALMTGIVFLARSPSIGHSFNTITDVAVVMVLLPYIYASVAIPFFARGVFGPLAYWAATLCGAVGAAFCLWLVIDSPVDAVTISLVVILATALLYQYSRMTGSKAAKAT